MKLTKINKHFFPDKEDVNQAFFYLSGEINEETVTPLIEAIIAINGENDDIKKARKLLTESAELDELPEPIDVINVLICSPGGELDEAISAIAVMQGSEVPIRTISLGQAGSSALMILMSGHQRVSIPYSQLLSHQFSTELGGNFGTISESISELTNIHKKLINLYHRATGLDTNKIEDVLMKNTDTWLTPDEALSFGIIDLISELS